MSYVFVVQVQPTASFTVSLKSNFLPAKKNGQLVKMPSHQMLLVRSNIDIFQLVQVKIMIVKLNLYNLCWFSPAPELHK